MARRPPLPLPRKPLYGRADRAWTPTQGNRKGGQRPPGGLNATQHPTITSYTTNRDLTPDDEESRYDRLVAWLKNHPVVAFIAVAFIVASGLVTIVGSP